MEECFCLFLIKWLMYLFPPPLKFNYVITCNDTEANLRQQSSQDDKYMGVR